MIKATLLFGATLLMLSPAQAESDFARTEWTPPVMPQSQAQSQPLQLQFAALLQKVPVVPQAGAEGLANHWPDLGMGLWPLQTLVSRALEFSPAIQEAYGNARAAGYDVSQAQSGLWPRVELNANSPSVNLENNNAVGSRVGASVVYNLVDFGKTRKQISSREFQFASLQDRLRTVSETTAFDTANAYLELVKHQRLENLYAAHIDDLQALTHKLAEIVAVFPGRRSELTQAQTRLGQANDSLLAVQAKKRQYRLDLMRQLGSYAPMASFADALPDIPRETIQTLMESVKTQHPAIRSALAEASAVRAQVEEAQAAQKPQVDLIFSSQSGLDSNGLAAPAQLYVTAKWLAFDGYGGKNSEQALSERALAAEARAGQLLQEVEFKVRSAQEELQSLSARAEELTALLRDTAQVRKDYYDQWRELGRRTLLDVLTAENEHLSTQLSLATSQVDQVIAAVRMRHEAGIFQAWLVGDVSTASPASRGTP
jgi:adhesin transport system outer membrane protein